MAQPSPGGVHDDHFHVRTSCSPEELVAGCEAVGPRRAWLTYDMPPLDETDEDLALELMSPMEAR
jgi:penicillin-insensitive murein endopeptidase